MCMSRNSTSICRMQLISEPVNNSRRRVFGAHDEDQNVLVETFEATKPTSRNGPGDPCSMLFSQQGRHSSGATPNGAPTSQLSCGSTGSSCFRTEASPATESCVKSSCRGPETVM